MSTPSGQFDVDGRRGEVTALLEHWSQGDRTALERLMPLVYDELRRIALRYLRRERHAETLQPTAVVHEAYLKLVDQTRVRFKNRDHFYAVASQAMRRLLIDRARVRAAAKRGAGATRVELSDGAAGDMPEPIDVLALEQALTRLAALDAPAERVVELRFYGGLTLEEAAATLNRSLSTVKRDWRAARAYLHRELGLRPGDG